MHAILPLNLVKTLEVSSVMLLTFSLNPDGKLGVYDALKKKKSV